MTPLRFFVYAVLAFFAVGGLLVLLALIQSWIERGHEDEDEKQPCACPTLLLRRQSGRGHSFKIFHSASCPERTSHARRVYDAKEPI